jgi:hypothetical protein
MVAGSPGSRAAAADALRDALGHVGGLPEPNGSRHKMSLPTHAIESRAGPRSLLATTEVGAYDELGPRGAELTGGRRFNEPNLLMQRETSLHVLP